VPIFWSQVVEVGCAQTTLPLGQGKAVVRNREHHSRALKNVRDSNPVRLAMTDSVINGVNDDDVRLLTKDGGDPRKGTSSWMSTTPDQFFTKLSSSRRDSPLVQDDIDSIC